MSISYYFALFKREFLQHNGAIWVTPLVLLCLMQIGAMFTGYLLLTEVGSMTTITLNQEAINITSDFDKLINNDDFQFQPNYAFVLFSGVICLFYLLDSLYSDRKDRSILFWRSLPVSEYENVAVKLLTSVLVIPSIFLIVGLVSSTLAAIILYVSVSFAGIELEQSSKYILYFSGLAAAKQLIFAILLFNVLLIPLHLLLLFVSAIAKRSPWLTLILPLLGISIVEGMLFRDVKVGDFLFTYISHSAQASVALVEGKDAGLSIANIGLGVLSAAGLYFASVMMRIREFEL